MNFTAEINKVFAKYLDTSFEDYRLTNFAGKLLYIEGHNGMLTINEREMSFKIKKRILTITGTGLSLKSLDNETALVAGDIVTTVVK